MSHEPATHESRTSKKMKYVWVRFTHFETCLIHIWDITHSYMTWRIHTWHDSFIWVTNREYDAVCLVSLYSLWVMAHLYVRHDSFRYDMTHPNVTWLIHMRHEPERRCSMSGLAPLVDIYPLYDTCVWHTHTKDVWTWLIHMRYEVVIHVTHTHTKCYVWTWLIHMRYEVRIRVTWLQAIQTEEKSIWNRKTNDVYDIFAPWHDIII